MGAVYRATDTSLGRQVAIKVLPDVFAQDAERLARFEREAKTLASLNHPNIAAVYGLESSGSVRALVMELVSGEDLSQRIARGAIPIDEALAIAKQMAEALEAAHEQGIVHRDLKPANIKVRPDGTVKVLDFGLAKAMEPAGTSPANVSQLPTITTPAMTQAGIILGTAAYMSPEQARGRPVDRRTDVWAFGCVLYEMLTGRRAFEGDDVSVTLASVLKDRVRWDALPPNTPAAVHRLLRRALTKDTRGRLGDIRDARLDLEEAVQDPSPALPQGQLAASNRRVRWFQQAAVVAFAAVAGLLAVVAIEHWREVPAQVLPVRFEIAASDMGALDMFALSPDGRMLAFVAPRGGQNVLWIRAMDTAVAEPLTGTDGASAPFWSPDSTSIGFFSGGDLKRIDAGGGPAQTLTTTSGAVGLNRGGAWGRDDVIVFAPTPTSGLFRIPAAGGEAAALTALDSHTGHRLPAFLPDGRHFLYLAQRGSDGGDIYLASLDAPSGTRLLGADTGAVYADPGYLLFGSQGNLYAQRFDVGGLRVTGDRLLVAEGITVPVGQNVAAVSAATNGTLAFRASPRSGARQFVWFDSSGNTLGAVAPPSQEGSEPEIAGDGRRLAVIRTSGRGGSNDVWLADVARGVFTRFTASPENERWPVWSPDGTRVAFERGYEVPGKSRVVARALDGAEDVLLDSKTPASPSDWSRDGRFLLYRTSTAATSGDLWVLPLTGDRTPFPFVASQFNETRGQFSPDGRWVAYESDDSGRPEVYVRAFPGPGQPWQVSLDGGIEARWAPDGRELFFISPEAKLMSVQIQPAVGGASLDVAQPRALFQTQIFRGGAQIAGLKFQYAVAPEGRRFLILSDLDATPAPITVILNWRPPNSP
jgi:Tol biopolymer transport system component